MVKVAWVFLLGDKAICVDSFSFTPKIDSNNDKKFI